ncbi:MAG TPA: hypothetical protein VIM73_16620 [Polyangiaceae bacterium]
MFTKLSRLFFALSAVLGLPACGDDDTTGTGDVVFTIWGEEYVEDGIPTAEFEDGWEARFSKFLIVLGDVSVADGRAGEAGRLSEVRVFDLAVPGPHEIGALKDVDARAWDRVGYTVRAAGADTERHSSATSQDLSRMRDEGYSVYVEGSAVKESQEMTFAWGFENSTRYDDCVQVDGARETHGIVVTNGGADAVELTIHGDHFFYDDLASPDAVLRFEPIAAADADGDGNVTLEELSAVKLVEIPEGSYGTGSASAVDDLGAFVRALTATLGHFRGEGHCTASNL